MVEIDDDGTLLLVADYFDELGEDIFNSIVSEMIDVVDDLKKAIIFTKLSGTPLREVSGDLKRSIKEDVFQSPNAIVGTVMQDITVAPYGPVHERGGAFTIPAHMRTSRSGKLHEVRTHVRNVKQNSYMASTFEEKRNSIRDRLLTAFFRPVNK